MQFEQRTDNILLLELNGKTLFCGIDASRIIFSPQLHLDYLPEQHFDGRGGVQETKVILRNERRLIAEGIATFTSTRKKYIFEDWGGWNEFFTARPTITRPEKVSMWDASWFSPGNSIEITKDDWEVSESSMDHLLSQRTVGNSFAEVFFTNQPIITKLTEFFSIEPVVLGAKKVIFETYPGDSLKKFF